MSGNAYQFRLKHILQIGVYVKIDGPHDKFGQVYGHDDLIPGATLHHIRGIELPKGKWAWPLEEADDPRGKETTS